jgi:hypothetical protein
MAYSSFPKLEKPGEEPDIIDIEWNLKLATVDEKKGILVDVFNSKGEYIDNFYLPVQQNVKIEGLSQHPMTISGNAIFIACLGLFGLASYTAVHRNREIGIRKVLGASAQSIVVYLSKDFVTGYFPPPFALFIIGDSGLRPEYLQNRLNLYFCHPLQVEPFIY